MKTVLFAEKSGAPGFAGNNHQALLVREDADYFYVNSLQSTAKNLQYPKSAWKIIQSRPSTMADFLQEQALELDHQRFVYFSYPYSCGLTEAQTHTKQFEYPGDKARVEKSKDQVKITLDPLKGSRKRKKMIIKLWVVQ